MEKKCPNCGSNLPEEASFCMHCFTPLTKKQIKHGVTAKESFNFPIPAFNGKIEVDILVEGMGRINFNKRIHDRKGLENVCIGEQYVYDFDIYPLPIEQLENCKKKSVVLTDGPCYK